MTDTDILSNGISGVAAELDVVVGELAELAVVETELLLGGADAQAETGHQVHQEQDDTGEDEGVGEPGNRVGELIAQLDVVLVDPSTLNPSGAV